LPPPAPAPPPARRAPPVAAAKRPVVHEMFGTKVTDDYEWLEDAKSPEVAAFVQAQTAITRQTLDPLPERAVLRDRVAAILGASASDYRKLVPRAGSLFVLVSQPPKQQPLLVVRADSADAATEKTVLDPNVLDPSGKTAIDIFVPSPDKRLVAVSLSKGGSESGDVHVFDVATGKESTDVIPRAYGGTAGGSFAWNTDGTGLFYTRYPRIGERPEADVDFYTQVWFHKLGTPESKDSYVMGKDFPRIAEIELERSDDGRSILVHVENGDGGEYAHHVIKAAGGGAQEGQRLATFSDELVKTTWGEGGKIYGISRKGAPRGKVVVFAPPFDRSEVVVPEGDGVVEDVTVTKSAIYVTEIVGGPSRIRRIPLGVKPEALARESATKKKPAPAPPTTVAPGARGMAAAELPVPPVSSVTDVVALGEDLLVRMESFVDPPAWYRYRASEHRLVKTSMAKASPIDTSDIEVLRDTCTSRDGTKVPVNILRRKGTKLDGKNPTILYGYGGYSISMKPRPFKWTLPWLEQRGVVAVANLRGGGELGAAWHDAGKLTKKQNVFDDFAACGKTMADLGYATHDHLAAHGRSNGGLLVGAAIVQHPEMFRAAVAGVGIFDSLRFELSPNGAFNVTEFGSVKDEAQFRAMYAYSPFHNVKDGTAYPAVLLTTGANDPRVDPYNSRKMTARLQAATSSDHPVLLRQSADVGHGMGSPLAADIDETTDMLVFLAHELGMPVAAPGK
ncbi:MAG: Prolyl endopeptidase, partial [Labilithrix sp.]|nr:Prolyl endopeptidase [Labilithrix sp.]